MTMGSIQRGHGCGMRGFETLEARFVLDAGLSCVGNGLDSVLIVDPTASSPERLVVADSQQMQRTDGPAAANELMATDTTQFEVRPYIELKTRLTDSDGNAIRSLQAGETFFIEIYGQDIEGYGIFSLYVNVAYDTTMAEVAGEIDPSKNFSAGKWAANEEGWFGVGGTSTRLNGQGPDDILLARVEMTALTDGPFDLQLYLDQNQILHPATVYYIPAALEPAEVLYQGQPLEPTPFDSAPTLSKADGYVPKSRNPVTNGDQPLPLFDEGSALPVPKLRLAAVVTDIDGRVTDTLKAGDAYFLEVIAEDISGMSELTAFLNVNVRFDPDLAEVTREHAAKLDLTVHHDAGSILVSESLITVEGIEATNERIARIPLTALADGALEPTVLLARGEAYGESFLVNTGRALLPAEVLVDGQPIEEVVITRNALHSETDENRESSLPVSLDLVSVENVSRMAPVEYASTTEPPLLFAMPGQLKRASVQHGRPPSAVDELFRRMAGQEEEESRSLPLFE